MKKEVLYKGATQVKQKDVIALDAKNNCIKRRD